MPCIAIRITVEYASDSTAAYSTEMREDWMLSGPDRAKHLGR